MSVSRQQRKIVVYRSGQVVGAEDQVDVFYGTPQLKGQKSSQTVWSRWMSREYKHETCRAYKPIYLCTVCII